MAGAMRPRVKRECEVTWFDRDGAPETKRMVPDVAFLMEIEGCGISLTGLVGDMQARKVNLGQISYLVAAALNKAGWRKVTPDDVYEVTATPDGMEMVMGILAAVMGAVFPPEKPGPTGAAGPDRA